VGTGGNNTTEPVAKFVPGFVDHDPFAQGEPFQSDGTANDVEWPSPIVDESDDIDVLATTQPTGGYYTPEIRPPEPDTSPVVSASATSTAQGLVWTHANTISTLEGTGESVIDWRWKQKFLGKSRQTENDRFLQPPTATDAEGNVFSLIQTNEFSSQNLAKEEAELVADIKHVEQTKPSWLK